MELTCVIYCNDVLFLKGMHLDVTLMKDSISSDIFEFSGSLVIVLSRCRVNKSSTPQGKQELRLHNVEATYFSSIDYAMTMNVQHVPALVVYKMPPRT
jgi:hypothetical protein